MPSAYEILGLTREVDDETVRRRFLSLTRDFPPEQFPDRFAAIRAAYEKLKDRDSRARYFLFDCGAEDSIDAIIEEAACRTPRPRIGLTRMLTLVHTPERP